MTDTDNPTDAQPIAVGLIEHNPLAARQLHRLLDGDPGFLVFSHEEVFDAPSNARPPIQVFVLDNSTLPTALSRYLRTLRLRYPDAAVLVLDHAQPAEELSRLLLLGIQGFIPFDRAAEELPIAVRALADGHLWVASEVLEQHARFSSQLTRARTLKGTPLTRREHRILELVQRRLANKEIATILSISEHTVKFHLGNIFLKLGVPDRRAARDLANTRALRDLLPSKFK